MGSIPWPAAGSILSGISTLLLLWYLREHRGIPSANWLLLTLVAQACGVSPTAAACSCSTRRFAGHSKL